MSNRQQTRHLHSKYPPSNWQSNLRRNLLIDGIHVDYSLKEFAPRHLRWLIYYCLFALLSGFSDVSAAPAQSELNRVVIKLKERSLTIFSSKDGKTLLKTKIGIGRGCNANASAIKRSMEDCITPTGNFSVDIILADATKSSNSAALQQKYKNDLRAMKYLGSKTGLARLFANMNSIDFNGDGNADTAYGAGYLGLDSKDAITGPKFSQFKGTDYWFSIALHGTPDEKRNIGQAHSGGCVQLPGAALDRALKDRLIQIGTPVNIVR